MKRVTPISLSEKYLGIQPRIIQYKTSDIDQLITHEPKQQISQIQFEDWIFCRYRNLSPKKIFNTQAIVSQNISPINRYLENKVTLLSKFDKSEFHTIADIKLVKELFLPYQINTEETIPLKHPWIQILNLDGFKLYEIVGEINQQNNKNKKRKKDKLDLKIKKLNPLVSLKGITISPI